MGHHCCSKQKVKRGLWSPEEDEKLFNYITTHGLGSWSSVPKLAGLQRCGKSCRLRWINYLRPDLKKGSFTEEEERTIIEVHRILGNRWAQIAKHLPGRTDNEVKNFWNSCIKKKLLAQGLDPNTHNLLPSHQKHPKKPNNAPKVISHHIPSSPSSLVFSIDPKSENNIISNTIDSCFTSPNIVQQQSTNYSTFISNTKDYTQKHNTISDFSSHMNPWGYDMVQESSMWSTITSMENFEHQTQSIEGVMQPQETTSICDEEAQFELSSLQNVNASLNAIHLGYGFGDHSTSIVPSYLYDDVNLFVDRVAWDNY